MFLPVTAATGRDNGSLGEDTMWNYCSTDYSGYAAETEAARTKRLRIVANYVLVGESSARANYTDWVNDIYCYMDGEGYPTNRIQSTHYVGTQYITLIAIAE